MILHRKLSLLVITAIFVFSAALLMVIAPQGVQAAQSGGGLIGQPNPPPQPNNVFTNPLAANSDIRDVLVKIIQFLLGLVGLLALLALVWGGLSMIIGFGSEDKVAHAKKIIFWAIAGLVVAGLSYVIVRIVAQDLLGL